MARNLDLAPEHREAIMSAIFNGLQHGGPTGPVLEMVGVSRSTFLRWCEERPEWAETAARVRELWAERLVEECPKVAANEELDPKSRRVIVDTNLKVAALLAPKRFSQAALDRMVAPPEEETKMTPEDLARAMLGALSVANRAQLPAPVDGEFTEVLDDDL